MLPQMVDLGPIGTVDLEGHRVGIAKRLKQGFFTDGRVLTWEYPRLAPDGEQMDLVEVMYIEDGLIKRHRVYLGLARLEHADFQGSVTRHSAAAPLATAANRAAADGVKPRDLAPALTADGYSMR